MKFEKQDTLVKINKTFENVTFNSRKLKKLAEIICSRFSKQSRPATYEVGIAVVGNKQIQKINKKFLGRDKPTDCISFDLSDDGCCRTFELVINGEMAKTQARLHSHSAEAELALYIVHGLLHNLGFDDASRRQAEKMHRAEDEILNEFGYGPVYNS